MNEQKPSVGRVAHYVSHTGQCRAALIAEVTPGGADVAVLSVLHPGELPYVYGPRHAEPASDGMIPEVGSWHWPERVG